MGTNYYLRLNCCDHCKRGDRELHIGKSSAGWVFALRVHRDEGINTIDDWIAKFDEESAFIFDEYGREHSKREMLQNIAAREGKGFDGEPFGYKSWEHLLERNYAIKGPRGLLRHKIMHGCVGHGNGTFDYMDCDFS